MALPTASFDAAKSIFAGRSVIQLKILPQLTGVTAATDTITKTAHGLLVGQIVQYVSGTGFTGLTAGNNYFVVNVPDANTFKVSATSGGSALTPGTSSAGVFAPVVVFDTPKLVHTDSSEYKTLPRPGSDGVNRTARKVRVSGGEEFVANFDEAKRVPTELFSGALAGLKEGTATIWITDPSDASGKAALKSDADFPCDISRDGTMTFGDGDFTKPTVKISSRKTTGEIIFTADATA